MCDMCHFCGAELTRSSNRKEKQENGNSMNLNGGDPIWSCKFCGEKQDKESIMKDGSRPWATSSISPTASLISSDSCVSSCIDFSVDSNSVGRGYQEEDSTDSSQEDLTFGSKGHSQSLTLPTYVNGIHRSITTVKSNLEEGNSVNNRCTVWDAEITGIGDHQEARDNGVHSAALSIDKETGTSYSSIGEMDMQFWLPPEPEDQEDELEGSVANYDDDDDDDDCGHGVKWGKPSCLISIGEEGSGSYRFKEERQKAMNEVMNGKFRALVGQLLKSVGVASGEDGDSWVDRVTSLSWEAASFVKPDAIEGKAMDPDGYVKVRCIATGCRSQSQVFKGLVFKKHAAHKHMPTKYKNPRLLLIQGALGLSSSGLSSFDSMKQEEDGLKSIIEKIEMCHPDVILVEKSVSRDIQESILAKGMTLVFDMKLHRLERVARCTGSPILSSDTLTGQKLRQCDSLNFEKFIEEHAAFGEGGKRPSKTLMFIEGCPTRLGCTILLKGTHSDELKRIKCVVQCAVVMAYHLILETSFLLDQRAMFSTIIFNGLARLSPTDLQSPSVGSSGSNVSCHEESSVQTDLSGIIGIPISNGFHEEGSHNLNLGLVGDSSSAYEPYSPVILAGLSSLPASLKKVKGDNFPLFSNSHQSMSSSFGINGRDIDGQIQTSVHISSSPEANDHCDMETKGSSDEEKALDHERLHSLPSCCEPSSDIHISGDNNVDQVQTKDEISTVLDCESILVLMSKRNASRGTICEQSHFSHIKFYRNFDVPLGKFLRDNLLNQRLQCKTCGEPPEAHFYYYAHHNKQLTIQVRRPPMDKPLPGETEGKLWMWSRCGKCKSCKGNSESTKRVLISTAARGLSFGKFLELSFSNHPSFSRPSSCGHSFQRGFLYFFGLGPMVAIFRYSLVTTYSVCLPPQKLEFSKSIRGEFLKKDFENVYMKGVSMFDEVAKSLREIRSLFVGSTLNIQGSLKEFSDIEEMLKLERNQFEVGIWNTVNNENSDEAVYILLSLNRIRWELLLESFIWDARLCVLSSGSVINDSGINGKAEEGQSYLKEDETTEEDANKREITVGSGEEVFGNSAEPKLKPETNMEEINFPIKESPTEEPVHESREQDFTSSSATKDIEGETVERINTNESSIRDFSVTPNSSVHSHADDEVCLEDNVLPSAQLQMARIIPITGDLGGDLLLSNASLRGKSAFSILSNLESSKGWIWTPFSEIRRKCTKDLDRGCLLKFESVSSHTPESIVSKLITEEGSRLYIPLGTDDYIVSDYEDELSSIIACALALQKGLPSSTEDPNEDARGEKGVDTKTYESSQSLSRLSSLSSLHFSSSGSFNSYGSSLGLPSDEHLTSFDGLNLLDSLVSLGPLHPVISMGVDRLPGKGKYSVVCLYASQFRDLRNKCCPSEVEYIASLSRSRNWDAKGGKSKSFFAKTLDDRFIIKEIKRTEFESFMKFAPHYFVYMNQCFEQGNQTCLAKILGIYQVRQTKSGKEVKHDLMVMENLTCGRSITRQYDLKGALHARFNSAADGSGDVLLDQNFVNDMNASPLYISRKAKRILQRAVWNDTTFLNSINVMDYSLLVGVDTQRLDLVCGIIDYLRQYTWDKQLENLVKSSLVPRNQLPTVISPKEYKKRFRKFITTHFSSVPDHWCSQRSSNPCKLCGMGENVDSPLTKSQEQGEKDDDSSHAKFQEHSGFRYCS